VCCHPVAFEVDSDQYEAGEGPCLDAIRTETIVLAQDLAEDPRWPIFGPGAATAGMRSLLSCRLFPDGTFGPQALHQPSPAQGAVDRIKAPNFATRRHRTLCAQESAEQSAQESQFRLGPRIGARKGSFRLIVTARATAANAPTS
jgi:hypothetical protein